MSCHLLSIPSELTAGMRNNQRMFHPFYRRSSSFPRIIKNRSFDPTLKRWSGIRIECSGGIPNRSSRWSGPNSSGCFQGTSPMRRGLMYQDILLIISSCLFLGSAITPIQILGMSPNISKADGRIRISSSRINDV